MHKHLTAALVLETTADRANTSSNEGAMSLRIRTPGREKATATLPKNFLLIESDPASAYTYVITSSITGAGNGLLTAIELKGSDATKALVGEYKGIKRTKEPDNKEYIAGFKIKQKEILIDAWNAITKCVLCMTGYMNDPLDENLENCQ